MKIKVMKQERLLTAHTQNEKNSSTLVNRICQKTHRDKEDLLLNKTDLFRMKKQVIDLVENKKPINERYGDKGWYLYIQKLILYNLGI